MLENKHSVELLADASVQNVKIAINRHTGWTDKSTELTEFTKDWNLSKNLYILDIYTHSIKAILAEAPRTAINKKSKK